MIEKPHGLQPIATQSFQPTTEHLIFLSGLVDAVNFAGATVDTNSNGLFVRFENGLQICGHTLSVGSITTNGGGTYGNPWRSGLTTWTYPAAFVSAPYVSVTPLTGNLGGLRDVSMGYARTAGNTSALVQIARGSNDSTSDVFSAMCIAVGPWK